MNDRELAWIQYAASFSSSLSIVGSCFIILSYCHLKCFAGKVREVYIDITKDLIHILAWFDLIGAVGRVFGQHGYLLCQIQAFVIEFGDIAPIFWNLVMCYNLYRWICRGQDQTQLRKHMPLYLILTLCLSIVICSAALVAGVYGHATLWCWVTDDLWRYLALYGWIVVAALLMIIMLVMVQRDIKSRTRW